MSRLERHARATPADPVVSIQRPRVTPRDPADWSTLRLKDRITPDVRVLFVGINPGVRSAVTGHHFAGFSNRFWKLLFESGLVPEAIRLIRTMAGFLNSDTESPT